MNDTIEVTHEFLERTYQALKEQLLEADMSAVTYIMTRMKVLSEVRDAYDALCKRSYNYFRTDESVDIVATEGAYREHFINLHKAVELGLLKADSDVTISFPDLGIEKFCCHIRDTGYLRNKAIADAFYAGWDHQKGLLFRISKVAEDEFVIVRFSSIVPSSKLVVKRQSPFKFSQWGLKPGDVLTYIANPTITCVIIDNRHVEYDGERYTLSGLWLSLNKGMRSASSPAQYFSFQGVKLTDLPLKSED